MQVCCLADIDVHCDCIDISFIAASISAVVSVGEYTVSIITDPRQGPFRIDQTVQFSCQVDPTPLGNVSYQWRNLDSNYVGYSGNHQNFSRDYDIRDLLFLYSYYFCEVSVNETLVGSATRIVEVQGELD